MKLYIYQHCPFCIRVRYVAGMLGIKLQEITVDYHDQQTPIDLVGKTIVPILVKDDGTAMTESSDIIAYLFELKHSAESTSPMQSTLDWQSSAIPVLQRIAYPRWPQLDLAEFSTNQSRQAWIDKKQTEQLNFAQLLAQSAEIVTQTNAFLAELSAKLPSAGAFNALPVIDQSIYFSILSGLCCEPSIQWPPTMLDWLETASTHCLVPLIKSAVPLIK